MGKPIKKVPVDDLREGLVLAWDLALPGEPEPVGRGTVLTQGMIRRIWGLPVRTVPVEDPEGDLPGEAVDPLAVEAVVRKDLETRWRVPEGDTLNRKLLEVCASYFVERALFHEE